MEAYFFMQILEMASNIILRLFCHLKACLKRFQRAYRAQILCEELKLKIVKILRLYDLFFNPRPLEATLATSNLLDPHI